MKKILLLAIIALSVNAFAQSKRQAHHLQHPTPGINGNISAQNAVSRLNPNGIFSYRNTKPEAGLRTLLQPASIQVFDSVYTWMWDSISAGWKIDGKFSDVVYDSRNNLIGYKGFNRNGTAWENYELYVATYDLNNNLTGETSQLWNGTAWVNDYQYKYTYDANNNETGETSQVWNGTAWVNE